MEGNRLWRRATLPAVAALSIVAPMSDATTSVAPLTLQELVGLSDLVVHGRVLDVRSYREESRIFTRVEVSVTEAIKGELSSQAVSLELYGGLHDGIATIVIGAPSMCMDEEMVVFLKEKRPGLYHVVSLAEGKFSVVRDGDGPPLVERDLHGIRYMNPDPRSPLPQTLEALKAAIESSVR
jgi:hypothetical protein